MGKLYSSYRRWATTEVKGDGIIVASDLAQEWLLPWWWDQYQKTNTHPVTFVDFGMSEEMKEWCRECGQFIQLPVADIFVADREEIDPRVCAEWEKSFGPRFWEWRNAWFKKPLACLLSPYRRSIWIDLDCEVRGSVKELFSLCDAGIGISMCRALETIEPNIYNSGVIIFRHGIPLIETWADLAFEQNNGFRGDQEVLSNIIQKQKLVIHELPKIYNWSRLLKENAEAIILHWHGDYGKSHIHHQMSKISREGIDIYE